MELIRRAARAVLAEQYGLANSKLRNDGSIIMANITWSREKLKEFKAALAQADDNMDKAFEFEGHPFLVTYARYLIEYLEGKLPK